MINKTKFYAHLYVLDKRLIKMSCDKYRWDVPDVKLYSAVIIQAARDLDLDFFNTELYRAYCACLRLNPYVIKKLIEGYVEESTI